MGGEDEAAPTATIEPTLPPLTGCVPEILSPSKESIMDNGCSNGSDSIDWEFVWSECPNAQTYELFVIGPTATIPVIEINTITTNHFSQSVGYITDQNRMQWRWKVRAMQNEVWGDWSPESTFDVEQLDTDCPASGG